MKVRFYGKLAEFFGSEREVSIGAPCSVEDMRRRLLTEHPEATEALRNGRVRACIGDRIASDTDIVPEGAELEFLAPVSGG